MKEQVKHYDILGDELKLGSYVATHFCGDMAICNITKICNKTIRVKPVINYRSKIGYLVHPSETILISGESALAYILKHVGN